MWASDIRKDYQEAITFKTLVWGSEGHCSSQESPRGGDMVMLYGPRSLFELWFCCLPVVCVRLCENHLASWSLISSLSNETDVSCLARFVRIK